MSEVPDSVTLHSFPFGATVYHLNPPIVLSRVTDEPDCGPFYHNEEFDISVVPTSDAPVESEIIKMAIDEVRFLWSEYATAAESTLTEGAQFLRSRLRYVAGIQS